MPIPMPPAPAAAHEPGAHGLAALSPTNFGLVMATGIVSIAAHQSGLARVALALLALNVLAYVLLWLLTLARLLRHRRAMLEDLLDHQRAPGYFTTVAATGVLGTQSLVLTDNAAVATALWLATIVLWTLAIYSVFAILTVKARKPTLEKGIHGGWLLAVVATQSITVLGALLAARADPAHRIMINFIVLSMWAWGGMLYIWLMTLIFYRYAFFTLEPDDMTPPYWINMGAMAISTLGGALLIDNAGHAPLLLAVLPWLKGMTVIYWATGTWWIPLLLLLGAWRYVLRRSPLHYDPMYWAVVFPLGMYATATGTMVRVLELHFLDELPPLFLALALGTWVVVFAAMCASVVRALRGRRAPDHGR